MNNNEVKWLFEGEMFNGEDNRLIEMLNKMGIRNTVTKFGYSYEDYIGHYKDNDCVVFRGSFQFASVIRRKAKWIPGVYCNLPEFECYKYYPKFGEELLNSDYVMLPFGELQRKKLWLFQNVGRGPKLFIRPSNGFKSFAGTIVDQATWDKDYKQMGFYEVTLDELVVVAPLVGILSEWRAVVVDGKIVSASQYKPERVEGIPQDALAYAQDVVTKAKYNPDAAWTIDIAETHQGFKIIEVGSFSCAGLYHCDPEPIINALNEVAVKEWKDCHE